MPLQNARGAQVFFRILGRDDEDLGLVGLRRAQQIEPRRVAVEHLVAELTDEIDLLGIAFERRERNMVRVEQARDDLADATEAGDDHAWRGTVDEVELARRQLRLAVERRELGAQANQQRRRRHRQRDDQHQQIAMRRIEQPVGRGEREHDECEFTALREDRRQRDRLRVVLARGDARDRVEHDRLQHQQCREQAADQLWLAHQPLDVERHADTDEEEAEQEALERLDLRFDLVAVFGVGEQHAGDERAERHRDADQIHDPCRADDDEQCGRREYFRRGGARGRAEHRPQKVTAADDDHRNRDDHAQRRQRAGAGVGRRMRDRERRNQREDRDSGNILEQQDRKAEPAVRGADFLALGEDLQIDRRRGERQAEPDDERSLPVETEREGDAADRGSRQDKLQAADAEHVAPHDPQALRRQLHADHEQHQHHAELGNLADLLGVADQADARRPDQRTGGEIAEYRAELPALGQRHRDDRREQQHDRILKKTMGLHAAIMACTSGSIVARNGFSDGETATNSITSSNEWSGSCSSRRLASRLANSSDPSGRQRVCGRSVGRSVHSSHGSSSDAACSSSCPRRAQAACWAARCRSGSSLRRC